MQKNGSASTTNRLDSIKSGVRNLVDAGGERAGQLKNRAIDVKDAVVENSSAAVSRASALIKEHPIAAVAIAFGIGYIAVRMLRSK